MDNYIDNDDLGFLYLTGKKKDYMSFLYKNEHINCYALESNIILREFIKESEFSIIDFKSVSNSKEPICEVVVNTSKASIKFISHYLGKKIVRIQAIYDEIDKDWDVRSYNKNEEKLTDLNEALNDIEINNQYGIFEKNSFLEIINSSKNVNNRCKESKKEKVYIK